MKYLFFIGIVLTSFQAIAQSDTAIVTFNGIFGIKPGMKLVEVEKILNQKIRFSQDDKIKGMYEIDSAHVNYRGIDMQIVFQNVYTDNKTDVAVYSVYSSDPKLKTRSGIRIGDDKLKIINAYEDYSLTLTPEYVNGKKSKTNSLIYLDGESTHIVFHLINKKVVEISLEQGSDGD